MSGAEKYVGTDGCRAGWFCVQLGRDSLWSVSIVAVDELGRLASPAKAMLIDIPIGLLDSGAQERVCDRAARRALAPKRGSSVFPAPARASLSARDYQEALSINRRCTGRGISKQSWAIAPKIKVIDDLLQSDAALRGVLRESHPEICFWALNGAKPMQHNKKTVEGRAERMKLLRRLFPAADALIEDAAGRFLRKQAALDDIIDAMVLAVTAKLGDGCYRTFPEQPPRDTLGLPMEMVYWMP